MTLRDFLKLDFLTDRLAMWVTVVIGIITTAYLSVNVAPEVWSKIVLGIFGGGLPLISVRFLIKRKRAFFWMTVGLIVFSDVSMILSLTASQSHEVVVQTVNQQTTPPELKRLQDATDRAQKDLDELLSQQREAHTKAFLDNLAVQIADATKSRDEAQARESAWKPERQGSTATVVNSRDVFMAIPTALASFDLSRYMTLIFALLIATVYQGTVISTVTATVKAVKRSEAAERAPKKRRRRTVKAVQPESKPEIREVSRDEFEPEQAPGMTEVL